MPQMPMMLPIGPIPFIGFFAQPTPMQAQAGLVQTGAFL
jgi:hypothetical protein